MFTYVDEAILGTGSAAPSDFQELRARVASIGEAFQSGFDPAALPTQLAEIGFELLEDLDGEQALARYDPAGVNGLQTNPAAHIAHVRVR